MSRLKEIYIVFSTGRCGTGFLARYYGGIREETSQRSSGKNGLVYNPLLWRHRQSFAISHEPFDKIKIYWNIIACAKRGIRVRFYDDFLEKQLQKQKKSKVLITDNKIGRWFAKDIMESTKNVKIIYLYRDKQSTLSSLKEVNGAFGSFWRYETKDAISCSRRIKNPFLYHINETAVRWKTLKKKLGANQFIEVPFEGILSREKTRKSLDQFIGLKGCRSLLRRKVNTSQEWQANRGP